MRRIVTLVVVALVMAAMMVAMAMPAFAVPSRNFGHCHKHHNTVFPLAASNSELNQQNPSGGTAECRVG